MLIFNSDNRIINKVETASMQICRIELSGILKIIPLDWIINNPGKKTKSMFIMLLPITLPIPIEPLFLI